MLSCAPHCQSNPQKGDMRDERPFETVGENIWIDFLSLVQQSDIWTLFYGDTVHTEAVTSLTKINRNTCC